MIIMGSDYSRIFCPLSALNFPFVKSPCYAPWFTLTGHSLELQEREFHPRKYSGQVGQQAMTVGGSLDR